MGLDIANGQCYNASVPQNVTFSYQGLPFGLSKSAASGKMGMSATVAMLAFVFASFMVL
jgi:hypothetical protein